MSQNAKVLELLHAAETTDDPSAANDMPAPRARGPHVARPRPLPAAGVRRPSDLCLQALDSMNVISAFDRHYRRGSAIPAAIWEHAEIVSTYLGAPPATEWLPMFLNRALEQ